MLNAKKIFLILIILFSIFSLSQCQGSTTASDNLLFGLSERFVSAISDVTIGDPATTATATPACTTDVTVTTKEISLSEDGDVNSAFSLVTDNGLADTDVDGGTAWGYRSYQSCIYLNTAFTGTVEIPVSINSTYAGRVTTTRSFPVIVNGNPLPTTFTFSASGTADRQCIAFTRVIDAIQNARENPYQVILGRMVQKNAGGNVVTGYYTNKDVCDMSLTIEDDEGPGVRVSNISRIMEEPGGSATDTNGTFRVVLRTAPTANVTIPINDTFDSVNAGNREGTTSPTTLTFTIGNFNTEQVVTVTSVDDLELDGLKTYIIETRNTSSADANYNGIDPRNVVIYNKDQSVPGYAYERFDLTTGTTAAAGGTITGFATDENIQMGSTYATYRLKLRSKPTGNVTLNFSTNCGSKCTLLTPNLTFTTSNWLTYQTIQVEGRQDGADGGNQDYNITFVASSADATYQTTVTEPTFTIRSCDNDLNNLIQPCNFSGSPLGTTGNRLSAAETTPTENTTRIWLITKTVPGSTVTVPLSSDDLTEGTVPADVTITSSNYNRLIAASSNQIVLTHKDDAIVDGSVNWTAITALSTGGVAYNTSNIFAATTDNENYFYVNVTGNTLEGAATVATIDVCLGANNPTNTVTLDITCTVAGDECGTTISPTSIVFPVNHQVSIGNASNTGCSADGNKRSFTVNGLDDAFADGTQTFTVTMTKNTIEPNYASAPATVLTSAINNQDNELAGKAIFVTSGSYNGEMTAQGVLGGDSNCNSNRPGFAPSGTYRALLASDSSGNVTNDRRVGTNWVLAAGLYYYRCETGANNCRDEGNRLFIADAGASFIPTAMNNDFSSTGSDEFWTGLTNTLTPATQALTPTVTCVDAATVYRHNCHGFTYQNCPTNAGAFFYGQTWIRNAAGSIAASETICSASRKLICVQQ